METQCVDTLLKPIVAVRDVTGDCDENHVSNERENPQNRR